MSAGEAVTTSVAGAAHTDIAIGGLGHTAAGSHLNLARRNETVHDSKQL